MRINIRLISMLCIAGLMTVFAVSCKKTEENVITADLVSAVGSEATMDAQQDEIDDIATTQLSANIAIAGKTSQAGDERLQCAKVTVDVEGRIITIDFDQTQDGTPNPAGCTDIRNNTRKGRIVITWVGGAWYEPGTVITISPDEYSINGVGIDGERTITNISEDDKLLVQIWTISATHTITWTDNKETLREVHKTRKWDVSAGTLTVTQTGSDPAASGTTRAGSTYTVTITEPLYYTVACNVTNKVYVPLSGTKIFTINGAKDLTFNFGDGACDATFTITYNNVTESIQATN